MFAEVLAKRRGCDVGKLDQDPTFLGRRERRPRQTSLKEAKLISDRLLAGN